VTSSERRSQLQNREQALERLREILQEALAIERPRVATRPSKSAKVKRVESKRRRSDVKRGRQRPAADD
jgi:ribosome-associated protein